AHCRDIPLREGRAVKAGNREIAIFNLGNRFLAIENRCPHKGGPLADGIVSGATVVCPLHAWKLSLETGKGLTGPSASSCVETFRTRVEQGIVFFEMCVDVAKAEVPTKDLPIVCVEQGGLLNVAGESSPAAN
ncbi:MAG: nitrite reductase small subunit NirD, partial [Candidatus Sulfotelmatobacter sp.]